MLRVVFLIIQNCITGDFNTEIVLTVTLHRAGQSLLYAE